MRKQKGTKDKRKGRLVARGLFLAAAIGLLTAGSVFPEVGARAAELNGWGDTDNGGNTDDWENGENWDNWGNPDDWGNTQVNTPFLEENILHLAKGGTDVSLVVQDGTFSSGTSSNPAVVSVAADGKLIVGEKGKAEITVIAMDSQGNSHTLYCTVYVTEYSLSEKTVKLSMNQQREATISIQGLVYEDGYQSSALRCEVNDQAVAGAYFDYWNGNIVVSGLKAGKTKLTVTIDGVVLECQIEVTDIKLNKASSQIAVGNKVTLKVSGTKKAVTWKSSNKKIATVSSKGVVTGKKRGTVCITAKAEGAEVHCYVSVAGKKALQAVKKAKSVLGATYSQEKRMQKGYYDCSSLVWRSYSPYGVYLGNRTWAPTAADQGKWCSQNKKVIATKAISTESLKLQTGDLIFYRRDTENGRYKNIYHVAMFVGYEEYTDWFGESYLMGVLVEADGSQVSLRSYIEDYGGGKEIVLIARPT